MASKVDKEHKAAKNFGRRMADDNLDDITVESPEGELVIPPGPEESEAEFKQRMDDLGSPIDEDDED